MPPHVIMAVYISHDFFLLSTLPSPPSTVLSTYMVSVALILFMMTIISSASERDNSCGKLYTKNSS